MPKKSSNTKSQAAVQGTPNKKNNTAETDKKNAKGTSWFGDTTGIINNLTDAAKNAKKTTENASKTAENTARASKALKDRLTQAINVIQDPYLYNREDVDPTNDVRDISIMLESDKQLLLKVSSILEQHEKGWMNAFER